MTQIQEVNNRLIDSIKLMLGHRDAVDVRDVFIVLFFVRYLFSGFNKTPAIEWINHDELKLSPDRNGETFRNWLKTEISERVDIDNKDFFGEALEIINFEPYVLFNEKKGRSILREVLINLFDIPYEMLLKRNPTLFQNSFDFLLGYFGEYGAKRAANFYTPPAISKLLVNILKPIAGESVYDPTCGSGEILVQAIEYLRNFPKKLPTNITGRERNINSCLIAKINLFIHGCENAAIFNGDSLYEWDETFTNKFDIVLTNPPFSVRWKPEKFSESNFSKFGIPPSSNADYVYILHTIKSLNENGKAAIIVPSGVLFRGGSEAKIRREIIKSNYVDAVIQLGPNLLHHTAIPVNILILNKRKNTKKILFIDASEEYAQKKSRNSLMEEQIKIIEELYDTRREEKSRSINVGIDIIEKNDFRLLVSLYVQRAEKSETSSLKELISKQYKLESDLKSLQEQMHIYLDEI